MVGETMHGWHKGGLYVSGAPQPASHLHLHAGSSGPERSVGLAIAALFLAFSLL